MKNLILLSLLFIVLMNITCSAQESIKYDWKAIKEFRFYGSNNPIDKKESVYILANNEKISKLLSHTFKSNGYLPKGAQNYAVIIFNDSKQITIQLLPGVPAPIRVVKNKLFEDNWFVFDDATAMKWIRYINELKLQLNE